jgi:hypothetical protein
MALPWMPSMEVLWGAIALMATWICVLHGWSWLHLLWQFATGGIHPLYTLFNKNQAAWYFVRRAQAVRWRIVAIIIQVFYFPHICAFVVFLCLPLITVNHAAYILTKDTNTFA